VTLCLTRVNEGRLADPKGIEAAEAQETEGVTPR
jgi:hypothetical protein